MSLGRSTFAKDYEYDFLKTKLPLSAMLSAFIKHFTFMVVVHNDSYLISNVSIKNNSLFGLIFKSRNRKTF